MFNQFVWELYLKSGGKDVVDRFKRDLTSEFSKEYACFIKGLHSAYCPNTLLVDDEYSQLIELMSTYNEGETEENGVEQLSFDELIDVIKTENTNTVDVFQIFIESMPYYTTLLAICSPELFIPYYYTENFNVVQKIADTFEINMPEIPSKSDYEERLRYYEKICNVLHEFRKGNGWSSFELYAFLYDFAPKYIGGISSYIIEDLPMPKGAFLIGGSKDNPYLSANSITLWQCSPDTAPGDMIVMYYRYPISAVVSVWRSCSVGFVDPFFFYYRCTYLCSPEKIDQITIDELRKDQILGAMPIVRKNMQGVNGVELRPSEYNRLLDLGHSKAIKLEYTAVSSDKEYSTEKEVEEKVIKPLIEKIGYKATDYVQQLYLEIGNHNHALIPDFVLLPEIKGSNKKAKAFAVIEAKRSITTTKELNDANIQVRSYAKLLGAKYAIIVSQEKVWVYSSNSDYDTEVFSCTISELAGDRLYELRRIIGKTNGTPIGMP